MINILKPYGVYIFTKSTGILTVDVIIVPLPDTAAIQAMADPAMMSMFVPMTDAFEAIRKKLDDGWTLSVRLIAHLNPAENKPGQYEDKLIINILENEKVSNKPR